MRVIEKPGSAVDEYVLSCPAAERGRRSTGRVVAPLVLVLIGIVFFARPLFADGTFLSVDFLKLHVPFRTFIADAFANHELPLWNPRLYTGVPFLAAGEAAVFYPLQFPFFVFSITRAIGVEMWVHTTIALLTMYAFCRVSLRVSRPAAMAGALVFACNGYALVHMGFLNFVYVAPWVPLVFLAVERAVAARAAWGLLGAFAVGMSFLTGQPQQMAYALLFLPIWALAAWARTRSRAAAIRGAVALAGSIAGGLALAAIQVLPQSELVAQSRRAGGFTFADSSFGAIPSHFWWRVLVPDFEGWLGSAEFTVWIGLVGLALVVAGTVALARRREFAEVGCWTAIAVVSYVLAFGAATPLYRLAFDTVPELDEFRFPVRFLFVTTIAFGALAAHGFDLIVGPARARAASRRLVAPISGAAVLAAIVVLAATGTASHLVSEWEHHRQLVVASILGVVLASAGVVLARAHALPRNVAALVVVGALAVELFGISAFMEWNQRSPADTYSRPRALPTFVADHGGGRVVPAVGADGTWKFAIERGDDDTPLLEPGVSSVMGFSGSWPPRWIEPIRDVVARLQHDDATLATNMALLRVLGARWIIAPRSLAHLAASPEVNVVARDGALALYELRDSGRRARAYCGAQFVSTSERALRAMLAPDLTTDTFVVEGHGASTPSRECGRASIAHETLNEVSVAVNVPKDGWLLVADDWYPGWGARVDGRAAPIQRADAFFRAVRVPAGAHRVVFHYSPGSFRRGALISSVSWLALLVAGSVLLASRRRQGTGTRRRRWWG